MKWVKFESYVIDDGVIKPAEGAKATWYDPWDVHYRAVQNDKPDPPYVIFMRLGSLTESRRTDEVVSGRLFRTRNDRALFCGRECERATYKAAQDFGELYKRAAQIKEDGK